MTGVTKPPSDNRGHAWQLLVRFFFAQRAHLPTLAADLELSPAQCHVLHLIEPGHAVPMGHVADKLACDASNVTGLVDRLESRGLIRRRPSDHDRRIKVLQLTPLLQEPSPLFLIRPHTVDRAVKPKRTSEEVSGAGASSSDARRSRRVLRLHEADHFRIVSQRRVRQATDIKWIAGQVGNKLE